MSALGTGRRFAHVALRCRSGVVTAGGQAPSCIALSHTPGGDGDPAATSTSTAYSEREGSGTAHTHLLTARLPIVHRHPLSPSWRRHATAMPPALAFASLQGHRHTSNLSSSSSSGSSNSSPQEGTASPAAPEATNVRPNRLQALWQDIIDPNRRATNIIITVCLYTYCLAQDGAGTWQALANHIPMVMDGEWYRLLSYGFLHTHFLHLLGNMSVVHFEGPEIEPWVGRRRFVAIYLTSVLAGGLAWVALGDPSRMMLGASGGACGLVAAYVAMRVRQGLWDEIDSRWLRETLALNIALWTALGLLGISIAHCAHAGGALAGGGLCWLLGPRPLGPQPAPKPPGGRIGAAPRAAAARWLPGPTRTAEAPGSPGAAGQAER